MAKFNEKNGDFSSVLFDIDFSHKKKATLRNFRLQVSQIKFANKFNKVGANYSILKL